MRRMIGNNNTAFARFVPTACSFFFFFFFFFFFSERELALALPSPRKQKLSNYEVVRFKEVKVDALDESKVESFRVEAFGVSYEVSLEQSYEKLLKNGKVLVDYLGVPQSTDDDADEENAKDSMNEFLEQKAKYCFYRGKVIDSDRTSIVCGNLCDEYLYFNIMAKNSSVSFAMPHADFADEVASERERVFQKLSSAARSSSGAVNTNSRKYVLENTYFIAFRAEDELDSDNAGFIRDKIVYPPGHVNQDHIHEDDDASMNNRRKLQAASWTATVETYVIIDKKRVSDYTSDNKTELECVIDSLNVMNFVVALYEGVFSPELEIVVSGVGIYNALSTEPWEHLTGDDCDYCADNSTEIDSENFLDEISNFVATALKSDDDHFNNADNVLVMSGHKFDGPIGVAWMDSICSVKGEEYIDDDDEVFYSGSNAINEVRYTNSLRYSAATVAHELGHNLGFPHDGRSDDGTGSCPESGLIMAAAAGYELETQWSTCSIAVYNSKIEGFKSCLNAGVTAVCGNGIVEAGEQCDCYGKDCSNTTIYGTSEQTCCNAATCQLNTGKSCSSYHDGCCDATCSIKTSGSVCREAVAGGCDVQETCDGSSKSCDRDIWKPYGTLCGGTDDYGACYKTECRNYEYFCTRMKSFHYGNISNGQCFANSAEKSNSNACKGTAELLCYTDSPDCSTSPYNFTGDQKVQKGFPCSAKPSTVDGIFSKVCDGDGACVAPTTLDYDNGSLSNTQKCDASLAPVHGNVGTCTSALGHGQTCLPTCNTGFTLSGSSSCYAGKLTAATCKRLAQAAVEAEIKLTGYSKADFGDAQKSAFITNMAVYLSVPEEAVTIISVEDIASTLKRRKLQGQSTDSIAVNFKVETETFAGTSSIEQKLVITDNAVLKTALNAGGLLSLTSVEAPRSIISKAPPPAPPPPSPPPSNVFMSSSSSDLLTTKPAIAFLTFCYVFLFLSCCA